MSELSAYIADLENKTFKELKAIWNQYFENNPELASKPYLIRKIAYRVQELKYGGLPSHILKQLSTEVKNIEKRTKAMQMKNGILISRVYKGIEFKVITVENGYEFNGMVYKSLTKIAEIITGTKTSGPLFFGLKE